MADRVVENQDNEVPEIPEILEKVLLFSLDEAKQKLTQSNEVVPFTALAVKENLFIESHPGESVEACFNAARHTVQHAQGAQAYALCYDGYVEVDEGTKDALIAEGGVPGADKGFAVGYLYECSEDGVVEFEDEPAYIGEAPNFMIALKAPCEYSDDATDEIYTAEDTLSLHAALPIFLGHLVSNPQGLFHRQGPSHFLEEGGHVIHTGYEGGALGEGAELHVLFDTCV